jgi:cyclophilin family peptidyl-prolyl cis-trans isomerase
VPSDKRQRQRENSLARQQALAAAAQRQKRRTQMTIVGVAVVIIGAAIFWATRGGGDENATPPTPTTSTTMKLVKGNADKCPPAKGTAKRYTTFEHEPITCIDPAKKYVAAIKTDVGTITAELYPEVAPHTVNNFVFLARNHYYDGIIFHRVIPDFMDQTGDPRGDGTGGPGYTIPDEFSPDHPFEDGDVAMAKTSAPNSGGSQFFIVNGAQGRALPTEYTYFGHVTKGQSVVARINKDGSGAGAPNVEHHMISVTITEE